MYHRVQNKEKSQQPLAENELQVIDSFREMKHPILVSSISILESKRGNHDEFFAEARKALEKYEQRICRPATLYLGGMWGGVFLMFAGLNMGITRGTTQSDVLIDFTFTSLPFLTFDSGFIAFTYCIYSYCRSDPAVTNIHHLLNSLTNPQQRSEEKNTTNSNQKTKKQPDLVFEKIIKGEQFRRQQSKFKRKWFDLLMPVIQQISALVNGSLIKEEKNSEAATLPIENTHPEKTRLQQRQPRAESKSDKLKKKKKNNKPIKKNPEESVVLEKRKLPPSVFENLEDVVAVTPSETKNFEPDSEEDKQKELKKQIEQLLIEKDHLEQQLKEATEQKTQQDKNMTELQKRNIQLDQLILQKKKSGIEATEKLTKIKEDNHQLIEIVRQLSSEVEILKVKASLPKLVLYVGEQNSMSLPSSLPPSLPLGVGPDEYVLSQSSPSQQNPYRPSTSQVILLPKLRHQNSKAIVKPEHALSTTLS